MRWPGRRFRLHCPYDGRTSVAAATDFRRHSSRQREYSTVQYQLRTHIVPKHPP
jgi:hypothetical protein